MKSSDHDTEGLFPTLDPPPGGLTRLRTRIREDRRRRARSWGLATAGIAAVAFAVLVLVPPRPVAPLQALPGLESDLLAIQLGIVDPPSEPVSIRPDLRGEFAVRRIPTTDRRVVFYLVGSRSEVPAAPSDGSG